MVACYAVSELHVWGNLVKLALAGRLCEGSLQLQVLLALKLQPASNEAYKDGSVYAGPLHTLRALYVDASSVKYAGSADMCRVLDPLCKAIEALTVEQCIEVLKVRHTYHTKDADLAPLQKLVLLLLNIMPMWRTDLRRAIASWS